MTNPGNNPFPPTPAPTSPYLYLAVIRRTTDFILGQSLGNGTLLTGTNKTVVVPEGNNLVLEMEMNMEVSFASIAAVGFLARIDGSTVQQSWSETGSAHDRTNVVCKYTTPVTSGASHDLAANIYNTSANNLTIPANRCQVSYKIYEAPALTTIEDF
jgi:hypothetical protein